MPGLMSWGFCFPNQVESDSNTMLEDSIPTQRIPHNGKAVRGWELEHKFHTAACHWGST